MGDLTITGLDEALMTRLAEAARQHGRSPEDEAREMIGRVLAAMAPLGEDEDLGSFAQRTFAPLGGFDVPAITRPTYREPPFSYDEERDGPPP